MSTTLFRPLSLPVFLALLTKAGLTLRSALCSRLLSTFHSHPSTSIRHFADLYNGPWNHTPTLGALRQLPIRTWDFSFRVQPCSVSPLPYAPYRSTLLREALNHQNWEIATWLLLEQGLLVKATRHLSSSDLLATIRLLCRVEPPKGFCTSSSAFHPHRALFLLDGLALMPLSALCTVIRSFWAISNLSSPTRELFITTLAFQRYIAMGDLDGARDLLSLCPSFDACRLLPLISRSFTLHYLALNPSRAFAPIHRLLSDLALRQTLSNTLPPASPSVLPVRPRL